MKTSLRFQPPVNIVFYFHACYDNYVKCRNVSMIVLEAKLRGEDEQYRAIDEALRTARFIRNSCIRYWMDNKSIGRYDLSKYCAVLALRFDFADKLNSMARQAHAERAWSAISRF